MLAQPQRWTHHTHTHSHSVENNPQISRRRRGCLMRRRRTAAALRYTRPAAHPRAPALALERATASPTRPSTRVKTFLSPPSSTANSKATSWRAWTGWPTSTSRYPRRPRTRETKQYLLLLSLSAFSWHRVGHVKCVSAYCFWFFRHCRAFHIIMCFFKFTLTDLFSSLSAGNQWNPGRRDGAGEDSPEYRPAGTLSRGERF